MVAKTRKPFQFDKKATQNFNILPKAKVLFFLDFEGPLSGRDEFGIGAHDFQHFFLEKLREEDPDYFQLSFLNNRSTEVDYVQNKHHPITGKDFHPLEKALHSYVLLCSTPVCDIMSRAVVENFANSQNMAYLSGVETGCVVISSSGCGFDNLYVEKIMNILQKESFNPLCAVRNRFAEEHIQEFKNTVIELTELYAKDKDLACLDDFRYRFSKGQSDKLLFNYFLTTKALHLIKENFPMIMEEQTKYNKTIDHPYCQFNTAREIAFMLNGIKNLLILTAETGLNFIGSGSTSGGASRMKSAISWTKLTETKLPIVPIYIDDMSVNDDGVMQEYLTLPNAIYSHQIGCVSAEQISRYYLDVLFKA